MDADIHVAGSCPNNPALPLGNAFVEFFNDCKRDHSHYGVLRNAASTVWEFANGDEYSRMILLVLVLCHFVRPSRDPSAKNGAKWTIVHLQAVLLLFRVGLCNALDPWLYTIFRQQRPCSLCGVGASLWGMPSGDCMVAAVVGATLTEYPRSRWIGMGLMVAVPLERIFLGDHTLGQALAGLLCGVLLHYYTTRTPLFLRAFDFVLNVVGGAVAFHVTAQWHKGVDYGWSVGWLNGIAWQVCAVCVLFSYYHWEFVRELLKRRTTEVVEDSAALDSSFIQITSQAATVRSVAPVWQSPLFFLCTLASRKMRRDDDDALYDNDGMDGGSMYSALSVPLDSIHERAHATKWLALSVGMLFVHLTFANVAGQFIDGWWH